MVLAEANLTLQLVFARKSREKVRVLVATLETRADLKTRCADAEWRIWFNDSRFRLS